MNRKLLVGALTSAGVIASAVGGARFSPAQPAIRDWYAGIEKPPFNPPDWVFGPVWTVLYALMVASAVRATTTDDASSRKELTALWWGQLALNAVWTPIFFGAKRPGLALADLGLLLAALAAYTTRASRTDKTAAWLFAPYIAWVTFAGVLNAEIVRRNP